MHLCSWPVETIVKDGRVRPLKVSSATSNLFVSEDNKFIVKNVTTYNQWQPLEREVCTILDLQSFDWAPGLVCTHESFIVMTNIGGGRCLDVHDYETQVDRIVSEMESVGIRHNDMTKPKGADLTIRPDGRLGLADFGWSTKHGNLARDCEFKGVRYVASESRPHNRDIDMGFSNKNERVHTPVCWGIFEELERLNITYAVIRNWEGGIGGDSDHPDIDMMVLDYPAAVLAMHATPALPSHMMHPNGGHRVRHKIFAGGRHINIDVRSPSDNYIDPRWMENALKNRVRSPDGRFFILNPTDYLFTLLYHAVVQKPDISTDYRVRLRSMGNKLAVAGAPQGVFAHLLIEGTRVRASKTSRFFLLRAYMNAHGYRALRPMDPSVPFRWRGKLPSSQIEDELHLIVLWNPSHPRAEATYLEALRSFNVTKAVDHAAFPNHGSKVAALNKFYEASRMGKSVDDVRGSEPFLVLFVRLNRAQYVPCGGGASARGKTKCPPINAFKIAKRKSIKGLVIHATDSEEETRSNLRALGIHYTTILASQDHDVRFRGWTSDHRIAHWED